MANEYEDRLEQLREVTELADGFGRRKGQDLVAFLENRLELLDQLFRAQVNKDTTHG